jgi:nitroimidazol reductase NimA-like FMN-containing flavoprotein (pyridoxamine 5'-phosphate oxidase superfamily)
MDEPVLKKGQKRGAQATLKRRIAALLAAEPYGVLTTRVGRQPYTSLMAYAASPDLKHLVFSTPVTTRKFKFLENAKEVAWMIDSRASAKGMMNVEALTATARAVRLKPGAEHRRWSRLLGARHPQLKDFIQSDSCALFKTRVLRYFYCVRFQDVSVLAP